jgi:light-regulated signal transduction histidine kinase (bacteriophytochrome)
VIWCSLSVRLVRDKAGVPLFIEGFLADITERKQAEAEIDKLNQELQRRVVELQAANRDLETMTYSVSHDLRQPLRHIDNFLGLLKKRIGETLDPESRRYMTTISDAALRMARLIDDLLSFSRSGRFEMKCVPVDLGSLAQEVVRELEAAAQGRLVEWRIGHLPVVCADHAMLRVVFRNLLSNALKFTQPRQRAEIEVGCLPDQGDEIVVFVRDNGVGFDMQYVHKLFRVFERLHGVEDFEGTGIGLANVRRVIARHGGRTWAEGKVDSGATFYFSVPRQVPD